MRINIPLIAALAGAGPLPRGVQAACAGLDLKFDISPDGDPGHISWTLGETQACPTGYIADPDAGGLSHSDWHDQTFTWCLPNGEYNFVINDSKGDGMCCMGDAGRGNQGWLGEGWYKIYVDGNMVHEGGRFGSSESTVIGSCSPATEGPTTSPTTEGPTTSPTTATTPAPTSTPWTIDFLGIVTNFSSSSEDELIMKYGIGKNRTYETFLYEKDCESDITGLTVNTTKVKTNINGTHDLLTLSYSFEKSAIANNTIWNSTTSKIELCQVVRLIVPEGSGQVKMDVASDIRQVDIDFTLSAEFAVENELAPGTVESAAGETNVSSYLKACKCNSPLNFTCESDALVPNTELHVCITSVSADVQVKKLQSMALSQGENLLNVILNGLVQISEIADMTYVKAENGVVVSTFVPTNIFEYVAGASINITGGIDMELVNSTRRLLADIPSDDALVANANDQEFELKVELQDEVVVLEGEGWMDSSGALRDGAAALLGAALLLAYEMW